MEIPIYSGGGTPPVLPGFWKWRVAMISHGLFASCKMCFFCMSRFLWFDVIVMLHWEDLPKLLFQRTLQYEISDDPWKGPTKGNPKSPLQTHVTSASGQVPNNRLPLKITCQPHVKPIFGPFMAFQRSDPRRQPLDAVRCTAGHDAAAVSLVRDQSSGVWVSPIGRCL